MTANYPPQPAAAPASDRTTLFGVLGIIFAFCCGPLGILFGILSLMQARKSGKSPTLAYIAIGLPILGFIVQIIVFATGGIHFRTGTN